MTDGSTPEQGGFGSAGDATPPQGGFGPAGDATPPQGGFGPAGDATPPQGGFGPAGDATPPQGGFGPAGDATPPKGGWAAYGYPGPQAGYGYPSGAGPAQTYGQAGGYAQPLVVIGDITVTPDGVITPAGTMPLKGAVWTVTDMTRTEEKIPTHAIVLAMVFLVICFLGLLFLLMKERTTAGHVQVTVNSGGKFHSTMIPVYDPMAVHYIMQQVNYARSVSV